MKKTIKKRAFVSAIAMLIVSAIVLTSSTFAWFSLSKAASVEKMELEVTSPEGVQISTNAEAWASALQYEDFFGPKSGETPTSSRSRYAAYEGNFNVMPNVLKPVSSRFNGVDGNGNARFYIASLDENRTATVSNVSQTAGNTEAGLVAFDIFFKLKEAQRVYFGSSEFKDTSNSDVLTVLRVGFQVLGNVSGSATAADAIALKGTATNVRTDSVVYEIDSENRSADAIAAGHGTGALTTMYVGGTVGGTASETDYIFNSSSVDTMACNLVTDRSAGSSKALNLKAGITKIRVYIWIEGQDIDCRNSVAGSTLEAALKFTID